MHLFHIPKCSIQNRDVHISVLNGALWDMEQVHSGICKIGLFISECEDNVWTGVSTFFADSDLCHHMASPGHNELILKLFSLSVEGLF